MPVLDVRSWGLGGTDIRIHTKDRLRGLVWGVVVGGIVGSSACGEDDNQAGLATIPLSEDAGESPPLRADIGLFDGEILEPVPEPDSPPPRVWSAPPSAPIACGNQRHAFAFDPTENGFTSRGLFWMMWFTMRAHYYDQSRTVDEMAHVGYHDYTIIERPQTGLVAFVVGSSDSVVVVFRGSVTPINWILNFVAFLVSGDDHGVAGWLHAGFAYVLDSGWDELEETVARLSGGELPVWVTGHSLGGALATLAAVRLARAGHRVGPSYTFAAPRVGDQAFAEDVWEQLGGRYYRVVNKMDLAPRICPAAIAADVVAPILPSPFGEQAADLVRYLGYAHSGILYRFETDGSLTDFPPMSDAEDLAYWTAQVGSGTWDFLVNNAEQAVLHAEDSYLCLIRNWHRGGGDLGWP